MKLIGQRAFEYGLKIGIVEGNVLDSRDQPTWNLHYSRIAYHHCPSGQGLSYHHVPSTLKAWQECHSSTPQERADMLLVEPLGDSNPISLSKTSHPDHPPQPIAVDCRVEVPNPHDVEIAGHS
jgi:hypothetical protein